MQNKTFFKIFIETIGYAIAGNILALVITFTLAGFSANDILMAVAALLSIGFFLTFMFSAGHKDGEHERKLVNRKAIDKPRPEKWYLIGTLVFVLLCLPCVALIVRPELLNVFRFVMPSMMALSFLLEGFSFMPYVFMLILALIPAACRLGHYIGYYEKWTVDGLVYKKKREDDLKK